MLGAILGIGIGQAFLQDFPLSSGVNWSKVKDVGLALLISPIFGFAMSAFGVYFLRKFRPKSRLQHAPTSPEVPPFPIRATLIGTSAGVSFAHGSNDGQKGVGLIMLILIALLPHHFSINPSFLNSKQQIIEVQNANRAIKDVLLSQGEFLKYNQDRYARADGVVSYLFGETAYAGARTHSQTVLQNDVIAPTSEAAVEVVNLSDTIHQLLEKAKSKEGLSSGERHALRLRILKLDNQLGKMGLLSNSFPRNLKSDEKKLVSVTEYAPVWVLILVALSLGVGTTIGWKRIVVTIGEKIGKSHLTFGQGMISELVAMSTIAVSALLGVPVSTTHCLSSGIAGGMFASRSGIQRNTVRNIVLAWILTLPVTVFLSAALFVLLVKSAPFS
jgi:PiT family inorganic phosphate transporter